MVRISRAYMPPQRASRASAHARPSRIAHRLYLGELARTCMCSSFCFLDIFTCQHSDVARVTALCSSVLPFRKPWWLLLRPEAVQARAALAPAYCDPTHPQSLARVPAALERGLFASEDIRATRQAPFLSLPLVLTFGRSPHQIWLEHGATSLACSRVWNLLSKMHAVSARLRPPPLSRNDVGAYIRF